MLGPYPAPEQPMEGGIEAATGILVRGLRERGVDVSVVTCSSRTDRPDRRLEDGVDLHVLPLEPRRARLTLYARERHTIAAILRQIAPDIVHAQGQNFYGPAALESGFRTVVTLHTVYFKEARIEDPASGLAYRMGKRLRGRFNARFERQTLACAQDVIVVSPYLLDALGHLTRARAHVLPNAVDESFFDLPRRPVPGRVLFAGTLEPRKDVGGLIHAFASVSARLPRATLHVAGRRLDAGYERSVRAAIRTHRLEGVVKLLGPLPHARLREEYAEACVLALPSREESSPLVIQQAMAARVAVVASRTGGIPALLRNGEAGWLVQPLAPEALARALVEALERDDVRERLCGVARGDAEQFRPAHVAARTTALYARLSRAAAPSSRPLPNGPRSENGVR